MIQKGPAAVIMPAIARALDRENEYTVGQTVRERMSFPRGQQSTMEGLRVQTSRLRRSLTRSRAVVTQGGVTSSIGSNVKYYGVHEFGYSGIQSVKQHTRKLPTRYFLTQGVTVSHRDAGRAGLLTRAGKLRKGFGTKTDARYITVPAHLRKVNLPARQMVQRTVQARMPLYQLAIAEAVRDAVAGQQGRKN
jgi:phage gpG-like protein